MARYGSVETEKQIHLRDWTRCKGSFIRYRRADMGRGMFLSFLVSVPVLTLQFHLLISQIGRMKNGEVIVRAITFVGKNYTLFQSQNGEGISFGKLDIQECVVTPLTTLPYDINSPFLLFVF